MPIIFLLMENGDVEWLPAIIYDTNPEETGLYSYGKLHILERIFSLSFRDK